MNERIKELAEQCYQIEDPQSRFPREVFNQEKFAELIVRDCLKQIYRQTLVGTGDKRWSAEETGYNRGVDAAYKKVKEHFGVK